MYLTRFGGYLLPPRRGLGNADTLAIGLDYKHDFIFTDNRTTDMDRIYAGLKFFF